MGDEEQWKGVADQRPRAAKVRQGAEQLALGTLAR
jgi:hypothetical protein